MKSVLVKAEVGTVQDYTRKWYESHLSDEEMQEKLNRRMERRQSQIHDKPKFKFIPSLSPADNPMAQQLAETLAISETDPRKRYRMACQQLALYERLSKEYNEAGFGVSARTTVRDKKDFWQKEVDHLLIEII